MKYEVILRGITYIQPVSFQLSPSSECWPLVSLWQRSGIKGSGRQRSKKSRCSVWATNPVKLQKWTFELSFFLTRASVFPVELQSWAVSSLGHPAKEPSYTYMSFIFRFWHSTWYLPCVLSNPWSSSSTCLLSKLCLFVQYEESVRTQPLSVSHPALSGFLFSTSLSFEIPPSAFTAYPYCFYSAPYPNQLTRS